MRRYDPSEIEPRWQKVWEEEGAFRAGSQDDPRPKFYALDMFPYPSGDLHMGHAEAFGIGDTIARYRWMQGMNVLHPIGWDAFGLPAENAAIKRGIHPREWTYANIEQQRSSFKRYGVSFDWTRQFNTCDPEYYRWTQWLFLRLFEQGLAYRKAAPANWCPKDQTVLANEQVINGRCERCGTLVVRRDLTQWFFRTTAYAQRLLDDMEQLEGGWSDRVLTMQRNWIGRSEGAEVEFSVADSGDAVTVFTTRPDTLWGATFFVFAPEHPLVEKLAAVGGSSEEVARLVEKVRSTPLNTREEADTREGISLGVEAINPVNSERIPCFVAPYVLMEYGTGAIMAVPAHDQRDFEFARAHGLEIRVVVQPEDGKPLDPATMKEAYPAEGVMVHSGPFDGERTPESISKVIVWLEEQGRGRRAVSFRLRDWLISRQRYWGAPIPIVHCPEHGEVAVPDEQLPVELPEDMDFQPGGESPLARHQGFVNTTCPRCGAPARRDTDTMDTFVDSSWYFLRYCSPHEERAPFDRRQVAFWMPADHYTGGINHAILHLLYARFFTKALHDLGLVLFTEPFLELLNQGMVIMEGSSMSKSRGNLVSFAEQMEQHGADAIRVTMLFAGPVGDDIDWKNVSADGVKSWLGRVYRVVHDAAEFPVEEPESLRKLTHRTIRSVTEDIGRFGFNTAVAKLMTLTNEMRKTLGAGGGAREAAEALVQMVAPMAPFIAEDLWRDALGHDGAVHLSKWPSFDEGLAAQDRVTLVVQVDGKVRDRIEVPADASEEACRELALASDNARRAIGEREVAKVIVRPPKLVNIVTKR
ncbi:MAG: leucine--tRNA ligase [Actinomycetota bacterium]|nr:leucine--tRNA ligase [Actinomycetota bacterium]